MSAGVVIERVEKLTDHLKELDSQEELIDRNQAYIDFESLEDENITPILKVDFINKRLEPDSNREQ
jgi:hypothetical protein